MRKIYIAGLMVLGFAACKPNIEPNAPLKGDADFSRYMAVGSSHTAGVMDGSLYLTGQMNSYPYILAQQLQTVGAGDFRQPLLPGEHGWPGAKIILDRVQGPCDTTVTVKPTAFKGALDTFGSYRNIFEQGPFNNMGIPGSKVIHYLVPGYGTVNPYAARMFEMPATARPVTELLELNHTFFTLWLGIDDVLNYALAGGVNSNPQAQITPESAFRTAYDSVLNTLTRNGAKGVVLNIPDVLTLPYFTTIPARGLELDIKDANKFNLQYNSTQVHFDVGMNYFVIEDASAPNGFRQIRDNEYIRMDVPIDSIKCYGMGSATPMPARYVITAEEALVIRNSIGLYNSIITKLAKDYTVPVTDMNSYLRAILEYGTQYNGADYSLRLVSGGMMSLDGIHMNGRGNALIANRIIETINNYYGSTIPFADVNKYRGTHLP